jgi:hypothetical protein
LDYRYSFDVRVLDGCGVPANQRKKLHEIKEKIVKDYVVEETSTAFELEDWMGMAF